MVVCLSSNSYANVCGGLPSGTDRHANHEIKGRRRAALAPPPHCLLGHGTLNTRAGIDQSEIDDYLSAMAGDYDSLLRVSVETVAITFAERPTKPVAGGRASRYNT